jgi:hypothetical protein
MPTVFILTELRPGVDHADYERWVREVDYPTSAEVPSIISFRVHRVEGPFREAELECDYIEVVEVTDLEDYQRDLEEVPELQELFRQIRQYLKPSEQFSGWWGHRVE